MAETATPFDFRPFPKMPRLSREIIVTEKIDGTNAQILIVQREDTHLIPQAEFDTLVCVGDLFLRFGSRTRWITPSDDNFGFAAWASSNAEALAGLGVGRHFGEWWGQGIQRKYGMTERRFSLFNVSRWSGEDRPACCDVVPVLYRGNFMTQAVEDCLADLRENGSKAAPGFMKPEGIIAFHVAGNFGLKKTLEKDAEPKSLSQQIAA